MAAVKSEPELNWIADPFSALVNAMSHQQIGFNAGAARFDRLVAACDGKITPERIVKLKGKLRGKQGLGFTKGLEAGLIAVADAVQSKELQLTGLDKLSKEQLYDRLKRPYVGPWTIDFFRLYHLHDVTVLLETDVSLLNAVKGWYGLTSKPSKSELREMAKAWEPNVAAACWFIFRAWSESQSPAKQKKPGKKAAKASGAKAAKN